MRRLARGGSLPGDKIQPHFSLIFLNKTTSVARLSQTIATRRFFQVLVKIP